MKKFGTLLVVFSALLGEYASAVPVPTGWILFDFTCAKSGSDVVCNGKMTPKEDLNLTFYEGNFRLISPSGDEVALSSMTVKGLNAFRSNVYRMDISYPIVMRFKNYPSTAIRYLDIREPAHGNTGRIENFPLTSGSASARANTTSSQALPAAQTVIGGKAYTVTFSNCRAETGSYVCTSRLTPLK